MHFQVSFLILTFRVPVVERTGRNWWVRSVSHVWGRLGSGAWRGCGIHVMKLCHLLDPGTQPMLIDTQTAVYSCGLHDLGR